MYNLSFTNNKLVIQNNNNGLSTNRIWTLLLCAKYKCLHNKLISSPPDSMQRIYLERHSFFPSFFFFLILCNSYSVLGIVQHHKTYSHICLTWNAYINWTIYTGMIIPDCIVISYYCQLTLLLMCHSLPKIVQKMTETIFSYS